MKKALGLLALSSLLLVGAGCATPPGSMSPTAYQIPSTTTSPNAAPNYPTPPSQLVVHLRAAGGTSDYGVALLTPTAKNYTRVTITMIGTPSNSVGEAEIRGDLCSNAAASTQYKLNPLVKGLSVTELNVNFSSFIGGTKQSIWVKPKPLQTELPQGACGNIY